MSNKGITILDKKFGEYNEGKFTLKETTEREFTIDLESSLMKLKEIDAELKKIPLQIESLNRRDKELRDFYNEGLQLLIEAKENYNLEDLELPNKV